MLRFVTFILCLFVGSILAFISIGAFITGNNSNEQIYAIISVFLIGAFFLFVTYRLARNKVESGAIPTIVKVAIFGSAALIFYIISIVSVINGEILSTSRRSDAHFINFSDNYLLFLASLLVHLSVATLLFKVTRYYYGIYQIEAKDIHA